MAVMPMDIAMAPANPVVGPTISMGKKVKKKQKGRKKEKPWSF
jgi:hypothetical protein